MKSTPSASSGATVQVVNLLPVAVGVVALLLALSFFGQVAPSLLAITLALILATALNPVARFFDRWMPRALAGALTVLLLVAVMVGALVVALPPAVAQLSSLSTSTFDLGLLEARLNSWLRAQPGVDRMVPDDALQQLEGQLRGVAASVAKALPSLVGLVLGGLFTGLVTLVMVMYALGNPVPLINGALGAVPPRWRVSAMYALAQILKQMGAWGRATLLIMLVTGTCTAAGFYLLGVENWLVFGLLAALGELVPTIGPIVATLPPVLFTLAEDPGRALSVAVFVLVFQQVSGFVLGPLLVGGAGNLHPLSVIVGVLLFGGVFGLVGAFLTVPFLIVIKAIYQHFYRREATEIPDAVAMALISGRVEEQLERQEEAQDDAQRAAVDRRDAALTRQVERGDVDLNDLEDALEAPPSSPRP